MQSRRKWKKRYYNERRKRRELEKPFTNITHKELNKMLEEAKQKTEEEKLEYDLKLHKELSKLYELITKLAIICLKKRIPLIIENPYSTTHYLVKYWAIPSTVIDKDRRTRGDYYQKPTQYWFINCKPTYRMILEPQVWNKSKTIENTSSKTERSLIAPEYANRFIREFII